jgi:hypothetical protein
MTEGKGQGPLVHGAWRATCFQLGDMCTNRCRTENKPSQPVPNKFSYEEITKGTGYGTNQSTRTAKRQKKTGSTLIEDNLSHADSNFNMEQEERRRAKRESACWYVPHLGTILQVCPEGVFRLAGGNLNCASTKEVRDRKVSDIHQILETWDIQGGGFSEVGIDWRRIPQRKRLDSWFRTCQDEYRTSKSYNSYKAITMTTQQQGGIAIFAGKEFRQNILWSVGDFRGLGRWNSWIIQADPSHRTRMVVAYQVGQARQRCLRTIYQQHVRYIQAHGLICTPRELFQEDILSAISRWIEHRDRILIFIDMNEHILTGHLAKAFQCLGLLEATHLNWKGSKPQTFVFGKGEPIRGMYHSPELEIISIMQLSFHKGVGDHKTTSVDVTTRSVIGKLERRVVMPQARELSNKNKKSIKEYIKYTTQQCRLHQLQQHLDNLSVTALPGAVLPTHQEEMEQLDTLKTKIQSGGEQRCRKIR